MSSPILNQEIAFRTWRDNERKIAAAELRRLARAARHADGSSARANRVIAARWPRVPAIGLVAGAWRSLGRGLVVVVGRRAGVRRGTTGLVRGGRGEGIRLKELSRSGEEHRRMAG